MNKYVSEIFGYPPSNKKSVATNLRTTFQCPFTNDQCDAINKKSNLTDGKGNLLLSHQTGACSVLYKARAAQYVSHVIICPYRFFEQNVNGKYIIFESIKRKFFSGKKLIFVPEVGLGKYGRADGILCDINNKDKLTINDYAHIELQSDATTGTRALVECVKDFFDGKDITKNNYPYGLNSKASIKGSSLQMIDKGFLFEYFNKKSIWVIQDSLFYVLSSVYNINMTDITDSEKNIEQNIIFVVVKLKYVNELFKYQLRVDKFFSTSPHLLQKSISNKKPIEESVIIKNTLHKISSGLYKIL